MKKIYKALFIATLFITGQANAQVVFSENFNNKPGSTAGGPGTYVFPAGWTLANVDNRAPAAAVSYVNNAWIRREDFANNVSDSAAFSTSWYTVAGNADDWMWTPAINLATGTTPYQLTWRGLAYDASYRDGYEVRIMTVAPTGATGVIGNMITASTVLFTTSAEASTWTSRNVNIPTSYNGSTVYIGFRNNSVDKFLLLIDDIKVERLLPADASVTQRNTYEFASIPLTQASDLVLSGTVKNTGTGALTNVNLGVRVYNQANTVVFTTSGTSVPSLAPGASANFTLPSYTAASADIFTIKYFPITTETDLVSTNDTLSTLLQVSDSAYARDRGPGTGSLGIGAGNGGYLGQNFTVKTTSALTSISASFAAGYVGKRYAAVVWNTDGTGTPTTIFAATDTLLYPSDDALDAVLKINGGAIAIPPGTYTVTAVEFDSTLALVQTDEIFTAGTTWVNWPTTPLGGWANNEEFGTTFSKSYKLRMNLRPLSVLPVKLISFTGVAGVKNNELTWKVGEQSGIASYDVLRSTDNRNFDKIATLAASTATNDRYAFTDRDVTGSYYYRLRINDTRSVTTYSDIIYLKRAEQKRLSINPNPVAAKAVIRLDETGTINTIGRLYDASGRMVMKLTITSPLTTIDMSNLSKGSYTLVLESGQTAGLIKL